MPFVIQIDAWDTVAAAAVTLRLSSVDDERVCHVNGQTWLPAIDALPTLAMDFFGGEFGVVSTPRSTFTMLTGDWPNFGRYAFVDARMQMWQGDAGASWSSYVLRFDGRISADPEIEDQRATLSFGVDDRWLDQPLLATYAGTGGIEGRAEQKGAEKPLALGAPQGVPGVLLDPVKWIYQLHAYGAVEGIDVPLERLARQFGSPVADHANYAALDAATVAAGQWATCKASGLVRMGAPPNGKLCFLMRGDKGGVDGWVRRAGAQIKRIAAIAGYAAKVNEASVDALDAARPYDLSLYFGSQQSVREVVQAIAASVNAVAGVSLTGELITVAIGINAAALTLRVDGTGDPPVASCRKLGMDAPWWRLSIGAQPFWLVHGDGDYVTYNVDPATQEALDILAAATGKVTYGGPLPSAANSSVDDLHVADDGLVYKRVSSTGILLDGKVIVLGGFRPVIAWTLASAQPIAVGIGYGLQAIDEAQAAADAALVAQTLANDAQATADGKIQTYYQATAPSGAGEGDIWIDTDDGNNQYRRTSGSWVDVQDTGIGQAIADAAGAQATADGKVTTFIGETAPTAEAVGDLWLKESSGQLRRWSGTSWGDPLADLTAVQQVVIVPPVPQIVYRDWQGYIKSGQYNRPLVPKVERGGVDIRDDDDVTYSISTTGSIVATVNNTTGSADKGKITATDGSSGSIILTVTVAGVSFPTFTIPFTNQDDNPPTTGGGSGNTGGSDSTLEDVTSTSFATITQQDGGESVFLIDITSGQTLNGTAPLTYQKSGSNTTATALTGKWQYRLQGDPAWLDFTGSAITGSGAYWNDVDFAAETGDATVNQSKASLATGTYEVQLVAAKSNSAAGNLQIISGTATVSRT